MFANDLDIHMWQQRHNAATGRPMAGALADNIAALADWANDNSDGWAHWPKPSRAAAGAMRLLFDLDADLRRAWSDKPADLTRADVTKALRPVRAFLTRHGVNPDDVLLPIPAA